MRRGLGAGLGVRLILPEWQGGRGPGRGPLTWHCSFGPPPDLGPACWAPSPAELPDSACRFSSCQQLLPATGVPVARRQFDHMRDMFDEYVKSRTLQNWKFWIVSLGFLCSFPRSLQPVT